MLYDAVIVGAGIAGLTLARSLAQAGQNILVIEKSRGVGGRLATRRMEPSRFDHGAQFYKVRGSEVLSFDQFLLEQGVVQNWFKDQGSSYRVASGGMTQIAKALAKDLPVVFEKKVLQIKELSSAGNATYELVLDSQEKISAKSVFITAPLPQALELLEVSQVSYMHELKDISYAKALVGLFRIQSPSTQIEQIQFVSEVNQNIFSVSNQKSKGVSPDLAFTVVMTHDWSEKNFGQADAVSLGSIQSELLAYFSSKGIAVEVLGSELKKWRYSHPLNQYPAKFERVGIHKNIYLLGDAFGGASIRGAIDSAQAVIASF